MVLCNRLFAPSKTNMSNISIFTKSNRDVSPTSTDTSIKFTDHTNTSRSHESEDRSDKMPEHHSWIADSLLCMSCRFLVRTNDDRLCQQVRCRCRPIIHLFSTKQICHACDTSVATDQKHTLDVLP
jgi:hypothetical protein